MRKSLYFVSWLMLPALSSVQAATGLVSKTIGGVGVAMFTDEFDAAPLNPAILGLSPTKAGQHKVGFGLDMISFSVEIATKTATPGSGTMHKSGLTSAISPQLGYFFNLNDTLRFAAGIYGVSGGGIDFTGAADPTFVGLNNNKTSSSVAMIPLAAAYKINNDMSAGLSLDILRGSYITNNDGNGKKTGSSTKLSATLGYVYKFLGHHTVGARYFNGATMVYSKDTFNPFNRTFVDHEEGRPPEIGFGYAFSMGAWTASVQYTNIRWAEAAYYNDLGWSNQSVFAVGGQYVLSPMLLVRTGFSKSTLPIPSGPGSNGNLRKIEGLQFPGWVQNVENIAQGIITAAVTAGVGVRLTPEWGIDAGFSYGIPATLSLTGIDGTPAVLGGIGAYKFSAKQSATEIVVATSYTI